MLKTVLKHRPLPNDSEHVLWRLKARHHVGFPECLSAQGHSLAIGPGKGPVHKLIAYEQLVCRAGCRKTGNASHTGGVSLQRDLYSYGETSWPICGVWFAFLFFPGPYSDGCEADGSCCVNKCEDVCDGHSRLACLGRPQGAEWVFEHLDMDWKSLPMLRLCLCLHRCRAAFKAI